MIQLSAAAADAVDVDGTPETVRERVAGYYDTLQFLYTAIWSRTGVHYGLWERGTWSHEQSVHNMNRLAAIELGVAPGARVLDAGCGVGGTSLFLAEEYGAEVVGITISDTQLAQARRFASRSRAAVPPRFEKADYLRVPYPDGSFDGVVAIESACYADPKTAFLGEAHRVLRPGGRLVVMDGFRRRPLAAGLEQDDFRRFLRGWSLSDLADIHEYCAALATLGFTDVRWSDKRAETMPSAVLIEAMGWLGTVVGALPYHLGLVPRLCGDHALACMSQRRLLQSGAFAYCVVTATKAEPGCRP